MASSADPRLSHDQLCESPPVCRLDAFTLREACHNVKLAAADRTEWLHAPDREAAALDHAAAMVR